MISELLLLLLSAATPASGDHTETSWREARAGYVWSFPRDHYRHPGYRSEWWYLTGQLAEAGSSTPRFGFQLTFFRIGLSREPITTASAWDTRDIVMGHAALTDLEGSEHLFSEVIYRASPLLGGFGDVGGETIAWSLPPAGTGGRWQLELQDGSFSLAARDDALGFGFRLVARPLKPVVLQGPQGLSLKSERTGAASLYASLTRLETSGTVNLRGSSFEVSGTSWLDQEIGSSKLAPEQMGWDWFGLQLDDGRELMLYVLRDAEGGADFARGTLVADDGTARLLERADFSIESRGEWRSPRTESVYPSGWTIEVPSAGLRLTVTPMVAAAENRSRLLPRLFYWEGPASLTTPDGRPAGRGYVELAGYGDADIAGRLRTEPRR